MSYSKLKKLERLYFANEALTVLQSDPVIIEIMTENGYPTARIGEGVGFHTTAFSLTKAREEQFASQLIATKARNELYRSLRAQFATDRRLVRQVIPNDRAEYEALGLNRHIDGKREQTITQAQFFYQQILADEALLTSLQSRFAMPRELVEKRLQDLEGLVASMLAQQVQKSEARLATQRRDQAMAELDRWMGQMLVVARRAFREDPRQLEKLGVVLAGIRRPVQGVDGDDLSESPAEPPAGDVGSGSDSSAS